MGLAEPTTKYVFVTGGVLSGVGKGITAASIGTILKARGLSVNIQKCDPYLNVDAGTLNPAEHGEVFVTKDGAEADLDLGHYERFLDIELTQASSLMSGRVLQKVIADERAGDYLGKTVQIIPHVTNIIQDEITATGNRYDIHIVEIGGTVGDYESLSFIEAIRELAQKLGPKRCMFVHVVFLPYLKTSGEFKTKPAQNAVRELRGLGIVPDLLAVRSSEMPEEDLRPKLSLYSGVPASAIAILPDAQTIYQVPVTLEDEGIGEVICNRLGIRRKKARLKSWRQLVEKSLHDYQNPIKVGVVAKYLNNQDTYMSVFEALKSACWSQDKGVEIKWIDAEQIKSRRSAAKLLSGLDGVIVPGGFGPRGIEGKILAAEYAAKQNLPYLGLCLGMQVAVIALARKAGLKAANSTEFDAETPYPVITTMSDQVGLEATGGTMRLGNYRCELLAGSLVQKLYKVKYIDERHRHRYEANNDYLSQYKNWGLVPSGRYAKLNLVEMVELKGHPFFVGTQAHPEFRSRPNRPHPLFVGFTIACQKYKNKLA